eukprot:TRINITY_DN87_c0_g1_i1.p1 TRINITY_DN87_c0_g1~~TRINITY_DN87_c0_g1_i1.p1  ORF type:complete len:230 (+),score=89.80 TRINITY_DN87_c0_g1_i1:118-807(+)
MGVIIFKQMEGTLILGYWNLQGLGEPIRLLLEYLGLKYEEKVYELSNQAEWAADKSALNFPFPNVPYLKDGEKVVCESEAIAFYIVFKGNRIDLFGRTEEERVQATTVRGVVGDLYMDVVKFVWNPNWEAEQAKFFEEKYNPRLKNLNAYAAGKKHILGDNLNLVDFALFQTLYLLQKIDSKALDAYPNLQTLYNNFAEIPQVKAYHATDKFKNRSIYVPTAPFKYPAA